MLIHRAGSQGAGVHDEASAAAMTHPFLDPLEHEHAAASSSSDEAQYAQCPASEGLCAPSINLRPGRFCATSSCRTALSRSQGERPALVLHCVAAPGSLTARSMGPNLCTRWLELGCAVSMNKEVAYFSLRIPRLVPGTSLGCGYISAPSACTGKWRVPL